MDDLKHCSIDELLEERGRTEKAIVEANRVLREIVEYKKAIVDELNLRKSPQSAKKKIISHIGKLKLVKKAEPKEEPKPVPQPKVSIPKKVYYEAKVTDHALVRYLERVKNIDLEPFRVDILANGNKEALEIGATKICSNGFEFRCFEGKVITIVGNEGDRNAD